MPLGKSRRIQKELNNIHLNVELKTIENTLLFDMRIINVIFRNEPLFSDVFSQVRFSGIAKTVKLVPRNSYTPFWSPPSEHHNCRLVGVGYSRLKL